MTIAEELKNLEKVQTRLIRFCTYLDKQKRADGTNSYDDLYMKVATIVGTIEDALKFDEK